MYNIYIGHSGSSAAKAQHIARAPVLRHASRNSGLPELASQGASQKSESTQGHSQCPPSWGSATNGGTQPPHQAPLSSLYREATGRWRLTPMGKRAQWSAKDWELYYSSSWRIHPTAATRSSGGRVAERMAPRPKTPEHSRLTRRCRSAPRRSPRAMGLLVRATLPRSRPPREQWSWLSKSIQKVVNNLRRLRNSPSQDRGGSHGGQPEVGRPGRPR